LRTELGAVMQLAGNCTEPDEEKDTQPLQIKKEGRWGRNEVDLEQRSLRGTRVEREALRRKERTELKGLRKEKMKERQVQMGSFPILPRESPEKLRRVKREGQEKDGRPDYVGANQNPHLL